MADTEFQEIAHSGGTLTFHVVTDPQGRKAYSIQWENSRGVAAATTGIYALQIGIPVGVFDFGGMGRPFNPPPPPGCFPVFLGSDSEGKFGRQCPSCGGYWRSDSWAKVCPYCGIRGQQHEFLTQAQASYVQQYCHKLSTALAAGDGDHPIDMDAVADAVGKEMEKPPFYYAEVSQQNKFNCAACGAFNDILGKFGFCSVCGTRNDLQELEHSIEEIRQRTNSGGNYEGAVKDAVSAFDSFAGQYIRQLVRLVPMTRARKARLEKTFQNLKTIADDVKNIFDIDILDGLKAADVQFATLMFHRRHVYEHKGGEADEKYIADSGDTSVRPKQALRETQASAHRIAGLVVRMVRNLHRGFHEIIPTEDAPIREYDKHSRQT
jgi:hypothetical protein